MLILPGYRKRKLASSKHFPSKTILSPSVPSGLSEMMQHPSISETTDANLMARFVPIAPRAESHALFPPGKKYDTANFVSIVISMRQKLYELQGDSLSEEPTQ